MSNLILNKNQVKAINSKNNTAVMASAGSGKTSVFTQRILKAYENGLSNYDILALTFTEKASREFKERIKEDLIKKNIYTKDFFKAGNIGTFHSVFFKLLKNYIKDFNEHKIYTESAYKLYLENNFNELEVSKEFSIKIESFYNLNKIIIDNMNIILDCETKKDYIFKLKEVIENKYSFIDNENVIEKFLNKKMEDKIMSFDDIIIETYFSLNENYYFFHILNSKKLIMVDEFQDNNKIINYILKMISNNNLFLVGDIYQSIYSFNNSSFKNTIELIEDMNIIQLDVNYRSSKNIVDFANRFIENVIEDKSDKIKKIKESGNIKNENIKIAENINDYTIPKIIRDSNIELENIAILARTNKELEEVKDILNKYKISFNEKKYNEFENLFNSIVLNILGELDFEDKYFERFNFNFNYKIENKIELVEYINLVFKEYKLLNYLKNRGYENNLDIYIKRILNMFNDINFKNVLESMKMLLNIFLKNKEYVEKKGVNVLTIHKSKGLEFESVILYNFEDKIFPKKYGDEEEKRIYYVAVTRAIKNLYITSKKNINSYTKNIITDYCEQLEIEKNVIFNLDYTMNYKDNIDFSGVDNFIYKKYNNYVCNNTEVHVKKYIERANKILQKDILDNLNNIKEEDIDNMLYDLNNFIKNNEFDNIEIKNMLNNLKIDKNNFFRNNILDLNFLNEVFTNDIHKLINFKNWVKEYSNIDIKEMKKLKKIVKNVISKKHTDITKDNSKKLLEIEKRIIDNKLKVERLESYSDFTINMKKNYYEKSNKEKRYYFENMINMYNTLDKKLVVDFFDSDFSGAVVDLMTDYKYNSETKDYDYKAETLMGNFINERKNRLANKRMAKIRYIEEVSKHLRPYFITFTLPSDWHRWKLTREAINNENKRNYGDSTILMDNPEFVLRGNNFEEHIIKSSQKVNEIWEYFYNTVKVKLSDLKKKNNKLVKKGKMTKKEFDLFNYDYTNHFKTLEPHKNLTAHGHILFFIDDKLKDIIFIAYKKTIEKFGLNEKFQDIQKIKKNNDTYLGKLLEQEKELKRELNIFLDDDLKEIEILREKIKQYDKLYFESSALYFAERKSKRRLKKDLKELLKKHRAKYIKNEEKKKKLKNIQKKFKDFQTEKGKELIELESMLKNYVNVPEEEDIKSRIKRIKKELEFNFASPTSYIFKYQTKNMRSNFTENEEEEEERKDSILFFNYWESLIGNKAKVVSISNYKNITQLEIDKMYRFYKDNFKNVLEKIKEDEMPLYLFFEKQKEMGNFVFTYESRLKESFNRTDFLKDVEEVYNNLLLENKDYGKRYLRSIAENIVIQNSGNKYLKFNTHKKLINVRADFSFVKQYTEGMWFDNLVHSYINEINENPHLSHLAPEVSAGLTLERIYKNVETIDNVKYKILYKEYMYENTNLTVKNIVENTGFLIDENYFNNLKNYDNHIDNYTEDMKSRFKDNKIIFKEISNNIVNNIVKNKEIIEEIEEIEIQERYKIYKIPEDELKEIIDIF